MGCYARRRTRANCTARALVSVQRAMLAGTDRAFLPRPSTVSAASSGLCDAAVQAWLTKSGRRRQTRSHSKWAERGARPVRAVRAVERHRLNCAPSAALRPGRPNMTPLAIVQLLSELSARHTLAEDGINLIRARVASREHDAEACAAGSDTAKRPLVLLNDQC